MAPRTRQTSSQLPISLSTAYAIGILRLLSKKPLRFNRIKENLASNAKSLSHALKVLAEEGCLERSILPEVSHGVEYSITARGRDLLSILDRIEDWARSPK